jgi:hypothetical protein
MSNRSQKAAALRALKEARNRGSSRTEEYEVKDEGDVYDVIEEDDYRELVEKRRQREDFIVDDGVCHYPPLCFLFYFFRLFYECIAMTTSLLF